jgi:Methyltransferase domain
MATIKNKIKGFRKKTLRKLFEMIQKLSFDILPRHYYSGIPDIRELRQEDYWKQSHSMIGIQGKELETQMEFAKECCGRPVQEKLQQGDVYSHACSENGEAGFGFVEADFLFCFIYSKRPKRIVQIGCGVSTSVILMAVREANYEAEIICIDPYPNSFLKKSAQQGQIKLIPEKAQKVPLEILTDLGEQGLLFIDSTHTVKPGSEVNRLIFEVLPRLKTNTYIHFHDIYFPYDYSRGILINDLFFFNETALLYAFLINNQKCILKASLSMLHYEYQDKLKNILPNYHPAPNDFGLQIKGSQGHFPSSAYLQIIDS